MSSFDSKDIDRLLSTNEHLEMLIHLLPFAAHIRDTKTNKYILANQQQAENQGYSSITHVTNVTYEDIYHYRCQRLKALKGNLYLEAYYKNIIDQLNNQIETKKEPLKYQINTLFPTGFIYVGILHKIPLFTEKKVLKGIFTFSKEITSNVNLIVLYQIYKKHYPLNQAINQFLNYLHINHYFLTPPTNQEVMTLLTLRTNSSAKYIAKHYKISSRTAEEHKLRLRNKLKDISLEELLIQLRTQYEITSL